MLWEPGADDVRASKAHPEPDILRVWCVEGGTTILTFIVAEPHVEQES